MNRFLKNNCIAKVSKKPIQILFNYRLLTCMDYYYKRYNASSGQHKEVIGELRPNNAVTKTQGGY